MKAVIRCFAVVVGALGVFGQTQLTPGSCSTESGLRSEQGSQAASIRFINSSVEDINLFWLDYEGRRVNYGLIRAGESYTQQTFLTHPWVLTGTNGACVAIYLPVAGQATATFGTTVTPGPNPSGDLSGLYRIRVKGSGRLVGENGAGDRLISTRSQVLDDFSRFTLQSQNDGSYRVIVRANNRFWHEDGGSDRLISTRYQPNDQFTRFFFERESDGSYRIRVSENNRYIQEDGDGDRLLSTRWDVSGAVPLKMYWSSERQDFYSTATADGERAAANGRYEFVRNEGWVFSSQRSGSVPLKLYWNAVRGDSLLVSTAEGQRTAQDEGYVFVRDEGYVLPSQQRGTVSLGLYFHASQADYALAGTATTANELRSAGYTFVRNEGYVYNADYSRFQLEPVADGGSTGNAPQPAVRSISALGQGGAIPGQLAVLQVDGANLAAGAAARLILPSGDLRVPTSGVARLGPGRLVIIVQIPPEVPSNSNVELEITNPTGLTAKNSFRVGTARPTGAAARLLTPQSIITTFAGGSRQFRGDGGPATRAAISYATGLAVGPDGTVYASLYDFDLVVAVDPQGKLRIVAGNGVRGYSGDGGLAVNASLAYPKGLAMDGQGNLYIYDQLNRIRRVTPDGYISTVAGIGSSKFSGDGGPALSAGFGITFWASGGLAADRDGNLYIADEENNRVRKVDTRGNISTLAGNGNFGFSGDGGPATEASLNEIQGVSVDGGGNVYITGGVNWLRVDRPSSARRIRRVLASSGRIETFAGTGEWGFPADGAVARDAALEPRFTAPDHQGNLWVSLEGSRLVRIDASGRIRHESGPATAAANESAFAGDGGSARNARYNELQAIAVHPSGVVYLSDGRNQRIRRIANGEVTTIAGDGRTDDFLPRQPATSVALRNGNITTDVFGNVWYANWPNHVIQRISPEGVLEVFAGSFQDGTGPADGPALQAMMRRPTGIVTDARGNVYFNDSQNQRVRKVDLGGFISTVGHVPGQLEGLGIDSEGNLYTGSFDRRLRRLTPDGRLSVVAGTGQEGYSGDNGPATQAQILTPFGMVIDRMGTIYFADHYSFGATASRVRKIEGGTITTVAGGGSTVPRDGLPATDATMTAVGLAQDAAGSLFFGDTWRGGVWRLNANGTMTRIAGGGNTPTIGDGGPAINAELEPHSLAFDPNGNLYVADWSNYRIRKILSTPPVFPTLRLPSEIRITAPSRGAPVLRTVLVESSVASLRFSAAVVTATTAGNWLTISPTSGNTPRQIELRADPSALNASSVPYEAVVVVTLPDAEPQRAAIRVIFDVTGAQPPRLSVDRKQITFAFPGGAASRTETVAVSNTGSGELEFEVDAPPNDWLTIRPRSGRVKPGEPVTLEVTGSSANLRGGTYVARLSLRGAGSSLVVPVTLSVSRRDQALLLTQQGLSFRAVRGGGIIPSQNFGVTNLGAGTLSWTVTQSASRGAAPWLSFAVNANNSTECRANAPTQGVSAAGRDVPEVTVCVDHTKVNAPGRYFALLEVRGEAGRVANTPSVLPVFLEVLPEGSAIGSAVYPNDLQFSTPRGANPGSNDIHLYNVAAAARTFEARPSVQWLTVLPSDGVLDPRAPTRIVVQPQVSGLGAGQHRAKILFLFSGGIAREVDVVVVVGGGTAAQGLSSVRAADADCQVRTLLPAVNVQGGSLSVVAGWTASIDVSVVDSCGGSFSRGKVEARLSGQEFKPLEPLGRGRWQGSFVMDGPSAEVTLEVKAIADDNWTGERSISLTQLQRQGIPAFLDEQIYLGFAKRSFEPVTPGTVIRIEGEDLADGDEDNTSAGPWTTRPVRGTQVFIGDRPLAVGRVSRTEIVAQVPFDMEADIPWRLYLRRGEVLSRAADINIATAYPSILTGPANVQRGAEIKFWCTGLGPLEEPVQLGDYSSRSRPRFRASVTFGGVEATNVGVTYSGLGYEVTATVPDVPSGRTELVVSVDTGTQTVSSAPEMVEVQ